MCKPRLPDLAEAWSPGLVEDLTNRKRNIDNLIERDVIASCSLLLATVGFDGVAPQPPQVPVSQPALRKIVDTCRPTRLW